MAIHKLSIEDAYDLVKSKRSIIHPNYGFIEALNEFSRIIWN